MITDVAKALLALVEQIPQLQSPPLSAPPLFGRLYVPLYELRDLGLLHCTVVSQGRTSGRLSRSEWQYDYVLHVAFQQRAEPGDVTTLDKLTDMVEEVADYLERTPLPNIGKALDVKVGLGRGPGQTPGEPAYSRDELEERGLFVGVVTVTYRDAH